MACSPGEAPARRSCSSECSSPEFEFWMLRNPSMPEPNLLTADELFSDGVLLPLHLLPPHDHNHHSPTTNVSSSPSILSTPSSSSSKRWLDIFKLSTADKRPSEKEKIKKDIPRSSSATSAAAAAELNINLWPFSRSRSAGAAGTTKHKTSRKASSAPCSRSNSRGESSAVTSARRLFPASPGRAGVPVGRASPVWQPNKRQSGKSTDKGSGIRGLNLNANTSCIGYRTRASCRGDDKHEITGGDHIRVDGNVNGNLFNLRAFFSKKVY